VTPVCRGSLLRTTYLPTISMQYPIHMPEDYLPTYQPYLSSIQFICQNTHTQGSTIWPHLCVVSKRNLNHWSDGIFLIELGEEVWEGWKKLLCSSSLWRTKTITHWHKNIVRIMRWLVQSPTRYKSLLFYCDCLYTYNHEVIVEQIISPSPPPYHESRELPTIH